MRNTSQSYTLKVKNRHLPSMTTATIKYLGNLRTESLHHESNSTIFSDAPKDNNGNGENFSPTDLTAVSLASCMLTVMGISAAKKGYNFTEASATVQKTMGTAPRRIVRLEIQVRVKDEAYTDEQKHSLKQIAKKCPVALSLHPDIVQEVYFEFYQ